MMAPGALARRRDVVSLVEVSSAPRFRDAIRRARTGQLAEIMVAFRAKNGGRVPFQAKVFRAVDSHKLWIVGLDLSKTDKLAKYEPQGAVAEHEALAAAYRNGEFMVYYQPLVSPDGELKGCEALMRWRQPSGTFVSPVDFVPVAERSGFIIELGSFTLREALAQLQQFEKAGLDKLFMSVNVSPRQLEHDDVEDILARARRNGCASRAALTGID
ncbi:hypothetical protein QFZ94_009014 [Paraburkholderia sp. JPY465]